MQQKQDITPQLLDQLEQFARRAQQHAYAPYSHFHVGAAIIDEQGNIHAGCNVENAAYPLGQCAEASAIGNMVLNGGKQISTIVIVGPNEQLCYPCGGCRQKLAEFSNSDTKVVIIDNQGSAAHHSLNELLPYSFGPSDLDNNN